MFYSSIICIIYTVIFFVVYTYSFIIFIKFKNLFSTITRHAVLNNILDVIIFLI